MILLVCVMQFACIIYIVNDGLYFSGRSSWYSDTEKLLSVTFTSFIIVLLYHERHMYRNVS